MKPKLQKKSCLNVQVIDARLVQYTRHGVGLQRGNPRKCIECGEPIKDGETWERSASAADPKCGRIVIIKHSPRCPDEGKRKEFQVMLARNGN